MNPILKDKILSTMNFRENKGKKAVFNREEYERRRERELEDYPILKDKMLFAMNFRENKEKKAVFNREEYERRREQELERVYRPYIPQIQAHFRLYEAELTGKKVKTEDILESLP